MTPIIDIQSTEWDKEVTQEENPVLVEFWHHKCVVCIEMASIVEKLPDILGVSAKLVKMNLLESKENRKFAIKGGIRSTPTFVVYCKGEPTGQIIGGRKEAEFIDEIKILVENAGKCVFGTPLDEE